MDNDHDNGISKVREEGRPDGGGDLNRREWTKVLQSQWARSPVHRTEKGTRTRMRVCNTGLDGFILQQGLLAAAWVHSAMQNHVLVLRKRKEEKRK